MSVWVVFSGIDNRTGRYFLSSPPTIILSQRGVHDIIEGPGIWCEDPDNYFAKRVKTLSIFQTPTGCNGLEGHATFRIWKNVSIFEDVTSTETFSS
jgi:hypothetical protein